MRKSDSEGMGTRGASTARTALLTGLCAVAAACAGGGGASVASAPASPPPSAAPADAGTASGQPAEEPSGALPQSRGFDGGTNVVGGFTMVQSSIQDSVLTESRNRVWSVLPSVFRTLGVETTTVDAGAFRMGNEGTRISRIQGGRLSSYLDCGTGILGPNADNYEVTMQLLVQLAGNRDGTTTVRTILDAYARPRASAGASLHCASQRTLEARVLQLIHEEISGVARQPVTTTAGTRVPRTGDYLRVQCVSPTSQAPNVGIGRLVGTGAEQILLGVGGRGDVLPLPAVSIESVEVRQRTSRSKLGGFVGAVLGAAGGVYLGQKKYDSKPDGTVYNNGTYRSIHYGKGVYLSVGGVLGTLGGFVVGRMTGSFFKTDTWVPAPPDWALRVSGATALTASDPRASCTGFSAGG